MLPGRSLRILLASALALATCLAVSQAGAAGLQATPSISLGGRWDSNVFNSSGSEKSDFILSAEPAITLGIGALGTTFNIRGAMTAEKYLDHSELDRTAAAKSFTLYPTDPIQVTPGLQLRPSAYFTDTTDSRGQFVTNPASLNPAAQGIPLDQTTLGRRTREKEWAGSLQVNYRATENVDTELRGSALKHEYDASVQNVQDFQVFTAGATVFYRFTPRLQAGPSFGFEKLEPIGGTDTKVYRESLAARYAVKEGHTLEARAGASQSRRETNPADTTNAPYGFLGLDSVWGTLHSNISGEYGVATEGVIGLPTKRFTGILILDNRFTPTTIGEAYAAYQKEWLGASLSSQSFDNFSLRLTLRHFLTRWAAVRMTATHFNQSSNGTVASNLKRDAIFLGVDLSETFTIY